MGKNSSKIDLGIVAHTYNLALKQGGFKFLGCIVRFYLKEEGRRGERERKKGWKEGREGRKEGWKEGGKERK